MKTCSVEGCYGNVFGKGWCPKHYFRMRNYGDLSKFDDRQLPLQWLVDRIGAESGDCVNWPFGYNHKGYGRVRVGGGKYRPAHRVALAFRDGYCPPEFEAAHRCHNRACVNPNHLYWASSKQNKLDCLHRGTQKAVLSREDVEIIKAMQGVSTSRELADKFGVTTQSIRNIWKGRTWVWLPQDQQRGGCLVNIQ